MNLNESIQKLKETDHSSSFEQVEGWLASSKKSTRTFPVYKVAASFILLCFITIACSVPVSHDEEIGYVIKGTAPQEAAPSPEYNFRFDVKTKFEQAGINPSQVSVQQVLHEEPGKDPVEKMEVIMAFPDANRSLAEQKMASLSKVFNFERVEILPIEETVERTLFESALQTFDIRVKKEYEEVEVAAKINTFLHENSSFGGEVEIKIDENGNRYVEIEIPMDKSMDPGGTKSAIENLYLELNPEHNTFVEEELTEEEIIELKARGQGKN